MTEEPIACLFSTPTAESVFNHFFKDIIMVKIRAFGLILLLVALLVGCATPSIQREMPLASGDPTAPSSQEGSGRVVFINEFIYIYNKVPRDPLNAAAMSARDIAALAGVGQINITINGKGVAQVPLGKYAQVILPYGEYEVKLSHRDVIDIGSTHQLKVDKPVQRVVIYSNVGPHQFELVDSSESLGRFTEIK